MYDAEPEHPGAFPFFGLLQSSKWAWTENRPEPAAILGAIKRTAQQTHNGRGPVTMIDDALPCKCYTERLDKTTAALNAAHFSYDGIGTGAWHGNSNGALYEWLSSIGQASFWSPGNVSLPGYHHLFPR
jgi:hypothetical protein